MGREDDYEDLDDSEIQRLLSQIMSRTKDELGIGQKDVARHMGRHQTTISRWEAGEVPPPPGRLGPLAKSLRLRVGDLKLFCERLERVEQMAKAYRSIEEGEKFLRAMDDRQEADAMRALRARRG